MTFTPIELSELLTNLGSGTVCLVMAIVLLAFQAGDSLRLKGYGRVRRYLAWAAICVVVLDAMIIWMIMRGHGFAVLDVVFVPAMYYFQLHLASVCLLLLIRSRRVRSLHRLWLTVPVTLLCAAHLIGFLVYGNGRYDYVSYAAFTRTHLSATISLALFAVIAVEIVVYVVILLSESRRYENSIDEFFSGNEAHRAKALTVIMRCFVAYFVFAGADFVWGALSGSGAGFRMANLLLVWVNTAVFVLAGITIINLHRAYIRVAPAFEMRDRNRLTAAPPSDFQAPPAPSTGTIANASGELTIEQRILRWSVSPRKPYLREGLTLASAADEMGIGPRLLSAYINKMHQQNFNTWVNALRIEEVKRLLAATPSLTMSEIACRTGFTDAPAMTKVFKRFTDLTPSTYRERVKAQ